VRGRRRANRDEPGARRDADASWSHNARAANPYAL